MNVFYYILEIPFFYAGYKHCCGRVLHNLQGYWPYCPYCTTTIGDLLLPVVCLSLEIMYHLSCFNHCIIKLCNHFIIRHLQVNVWTLTLLKDLVKQAVMFGLLILWGMPGHLVNMLTKFVNISWIDLLMQKLTKNVVKR